MRMGTGAVQFGDDWPGVFIRGDNALYYAKLLNDLLDSQPKTISNNVLRDLADLLSECDSNNTSPKHLFDASICIRNTYLDGG